MSFNISSYKNYRGFILQGLNEQYKELESLDSTNQFKNELKAVRAAINAFEIMSSIYGPSDNMSRDNVNRAIEFMVENQTPILGQLASLKLRLVKKADYSDQKQEYDANLSTHKETQLVSLHSTPLPTYEEMINPIDVQLKTLDQIQGMLPDAKSFKELGELQQQRNAFMKGRKRTEEMAEEVQANYELLKNRVEELCEKEKERIGIKRFTNFKNHAKRLIENPVKCLIM